ncbi:MAG: GerW family sporulation protein [Eubacteriales bacterium]|nr:GerW family sporulation protein [Eubacteriales bacterium]
MENNPIGELMNNTMESVRNILKVDTVVGDPIYTPDGITLVPISKVSVGFGGGGVEFNGKKAGDRPYGGGNATAVKIDPIGFLVIKEGTVRMINVTPPASTTVDRLIDLVPQVMDRVDNFIEKQKK